MEELTALLDLLLMLALHPLSGVLMLLLVVAAVVDCRRMRIPNWITVPGMLYGLGWHTFSGASAAGGGAFSAAGLAGGLIVLLPLYALRVLGAGDVKLMAAVGAFLGLAATLKAVLFVFVVGGVLAIAYAAWHGALARMFANLRFILTGWLIPATGGWRSAASAPSVGKLPYGIGICGGTVAFLVSRQLGWVV